MSSIIVDIVHITTVTGMNRTDYNQESVPLTTQKSIFPMNQAFSPPSTSQKILYATVPD